MVECARADGHLVACFGIVGGLGASGQRETERTQPEGERYANPASESFEPGTQPHRVALQNDGDDSTIPKNETRFSEKIMLKQEARP